jgi:hypothetical protein
MYNLVHEGGALLAEKQVNCERLFDHLVSLCKQRLGNF